MIRNRIHDHGARLLTRLYRPWTVLIVGLLLPAFIQPAAAQNLCGVPGAEPVMTAAINLLAGAITFAGIVKAGGNSVRGVLRGAGGSAQTRKAIVAGAIGIVVGLFFTDLVTFVVSDVAGQSLADVGIGCAVDGGGGGGGG
jgi:uncharacterized protein YacL